MLQRFLTREDGAAIITAVACNIFNFPGLAIVLLSIAITCVQQYAHTVIRDMPHDAQEGAIFYASLRPRVSYVLAATSLYLLQQSAAAVSSLFHWVVRQPRFGVTDLLLAVFFGVLVGRARRLNLNRFSLLFSISIRWLSVLKIIDRLWPSSLGWLYVKACGVNVRSKWTYHPIKGDRKIRLFCLHRWIPCAGVRGSIVFADVDTAPDYFAISYHWGTCKETHRIAVDGSSFQVPLTTHDALWSCSSPWRSRLVWIDYLCINQEDLEERRKQVAFMKDIYSHAQRTIVYLGMNSILGGLVHPLLQELRLVQSRPGFSSSDLYARYEREGMSMRWMAMIEFLNSAWFSRVWVVQEVALSKAIEVQYGLFKYDWDSFVETLTALAGSSSMASFLQITQRGRRAVKQIQTLETMDQMRTKMLMVDVYKTYQKSRPLMEAISRITGQTKALREADQVKPPTQLISLLEEFADLQSTDKRDKVFALVGLMTEDPPENLAPNYDKSVTVQDVFLEAAQYILEDPLSRNPLSIFALAGEYPGREPKLRSWIPDWTHSPPAAPLSSCEWDGNDWDYAASTSSIPATAIDAALGVLHLDSVSVDEIIDLSEPFAGKPDDNFVTDTAGNVFHAEENLAMYNCHAAALTMVQVRIADPYPFAQSQARKQARKDAFWRTLTGDFHDSRRPASVLLGQLYDDWVSMLAEMLPYARDGGRTMALPTEDAFWDRLAHTKTWAPTMAMCAVGRRVCAMRKGYLGCVPATAKVADRVIVVMGARVPFVIRRAQEEEGMYRIVGECYIHGIMDGEILAGNPQVDHLAFI